MPTFEREIRTGEPIHPGNFDITPQAQVWRVRLPGRNVGLIWNRPKAVIVRSADGQESRLPVIDVTRLMIWSMLAGGIFGAILIGLMRRRL